MLDRALVALESEQSVSSYPELLSLVETEEILDMTPARVEAAVRAGDIPAKQFGGTWRLLRGQLEVSDWGRDLVTGSCERIFGVSSHPRCSIR